MMLRSVNEILGYKLGAAGGEIGKVSDLLFDDRGWIVRYLVVRTGKWILPGKKLLVSPIAVDSADWSKQELATGLTKEMIESGPELSAEEPVSRQMEKKMIEHFNWPLYWAPPAAPAMPPPAELVEENLRKRGEAERTITGSERAEAHLRSTEEVAGYSIRARDGEIGHVEDFIVDDDLWAIRYLVVDTRNWLPGRKVLVSPQWVERVSWTGKNVHVLLSKEEVRESPAYDPGDPVNREYESVLYDYYGRAKYWL